MHPTPLMPLPFGIFGELSWRPVTKEATLNWSACGFEVCTRQALSRENLEAGYQRYEFSPGLSEWAIRNRPQREIQFPLAAWLRGGRTHPRPERYQDDRDRASRQFREQSLQSGSESGCRLGRIDFARDDASVVRRRGEKNIDPEKIAIYRSGEFDGPDSVPSAPTPRMGLPTPPFAQTPLSPAVLRPAIVREKVK